MKYDFATIEAIQKDKPGGICSILFIPKQHISADAVVSVLTNKALSAVQLNPGFVWLELLPLYDSMIYTESQVDTAAGMMYNAQLVAQVSGESETLNTLMNNMAYHEFAIIVKDRVGNKRLLGKKLHGLTFNAQQSTGLTGVEKNVYSISFEGQFVEKAPLYPF